MRRHSPMAQLVVSNPNTQCKLLQMVHEELGHRGAEETYGRLVYRFWWPSLKKTARCWVKSCVACQRLIIRVGMGKKKECLSRKDRHATVFAEIHESYTPSCIGACTHTTPTVVAQRAIIFVLHRFLIIEFEYPMLDPFSNRRT